MIQAKTDPPIFNKMFRDTANRIAAKYIPGTLDHIRDNHKKTWSQWIDLEKQINNDWDTQNFRFFKQNLKDWESLAYQMIELYTAEVATYVKSGSMVS